VGVKTLLNTIQYKQYNIVKYVGWDFEQVTQRAHGWKLYTCRDCTARQKGEIEGNEIKCKQWKTGVDKILVLIDFFIPGKAINHLLNLSPCLLNWRWIVMWPQNRCLDTETGKSCRGLAQTKTCSLSSGYLLFKDAVVMRRLEIINLWSNKGSAQHGKVWQYMEYNFKKHHIQVQFALLKTNIFRPLKRPCSLLFQTTVSALRWCTSCWTFSPVLRTSRQDLWSLSASLGMTGGWLWVSDCTCRNA